MVEQRTDRAALQASVTLAEEERIRKVYVRRQQSIPLERYARTDPFVLCSTHERELEMASLFRSEGLTSLRGLKILDVGCGAGDTMRQLLEYSASPELLTGIDLLDHKVDLALHLAPQLRVIRGSATRLPFSD